MVVIKHHEPSIVNAVAWPVERVLVIQRMVRTSSRTIITSGGASIPILTEPGLASTTMMRIP